MEVGKCILMMDNLLVAFDCSRINLTSDSTLHGPKVTHVAMQRAIHAGRPCQAPTEDHNILCGFATSQLRVGTVGWHGNASGIVRIANDDVARRALQRGQRIINSLH